MKMSEFDKVIESEFLHCKGVGSRKLRQRLAMRYEGVSEPRVQKILSKSSLNQMVNAKFEKLPDSGFRTAERLEIKI